MAIAAITFCQRMIQWFILSLRGSTVHSELLDASTPEHSVLDRIAERKAVLAIEEQAMEQSKRHVGKDIVNIIDAIGRLLSNWRQSKELPPEVIVVWGNPEQPQKRKLEVVAKQLSLLATSESVEDLDQTASAIPARPEADE